jgi:hypothetical protein
MKFLLIVLMVLTSCVSENTRLDNVFETRLLNYDKALKSKFSPQGQSILNVKKYTFVEVDGVKKLRVKFLRTGDEQIFGIVNSKRPIVRAILTISGKRLSAELLVIQQTSEYDLVIGRDITEHNFNVEGH